VVEGDKAQPAMNDGTRQVLEAIRRDHPDWQPEVTRWGEVQLRVGREDLQAVARALRDDHGFNYCPSETVVDYVKEGRFELDVRLFNLDTGAKLVLKSDLPRDDATCPTLAGVWATCKWHEREIWDMFGVRFEGHPDLRRVFLSESFQGYPLRKDFVDARKPRPRLVRQR